MADMVESVARAICAHTDGTCRFLGEDLGCKVGRGEAYNGSNCKARLEQLQLSREWDAARAAIAAMGETVEAAWCQLIIRLNTEYWDEVISYRELKMGVKSVTEMRDAARAALDEPNKEPEDD